jgi:CBS domain-containing protein
MRIEQLMTKDVACCGPDENLERAAQIMWERDCGFVPVVEQGDSRRVLGVLTDRDACMAAYTRGQALPQIRVADVMSEQVRSCKPTDDLSEAEAAMREAQIHRLPVVDDADQLLGVISLADIAREAGRETGAKRPQVSAAEIGETLARIRQPRELVAVSA